MAVQLLWIFKKTKLTDPKDQRLQGFYRAVSFSLLEQIARGPGCNASDRTLFHWIFFSIPEHPDHCNEHGVE